MSPRTRTRRLKRVLGFVVVAVFAVTAGTFALADSATVTLSVSPPGGVSGSGRVADFTPTNVTFTRPQGNAQIQAGLTVGRILVAKGYASSLRVDAAWLDPNDAAQVLNNPNVSVWIGLYYPIYQGTCTSGHANEVSDTRATMTYDSTDYCTALDASATGSLVAGGKLILSRQLVSGSLRATADDTAAVACTTNSSNASWCRPSGIATDQNLEFVGATIVTPGGKPQGQQHNVTDLQFFFDVRSQI